MEIKEIQNKEIWEMFFDRLNETQEKTFLQSWHWGEVQKRLGNKIWRIGIFSEVPQPELYNSYYLALRGVVLVIKVAARRGTFLMIPHMPIFNFRFPIFDELLKELKKIGKNEKCDFIRIVPLLKRIEENKKLLQDRGFREAPMHVSAYESTWKLDLMFSEEELLANMRKTTRYLIRQAQKNPDIEIVKSEKIEDVELYQKLNEEVAKRKRFTPFSFDFVKNEFEVFVKDGQALLFLGKYREKIIAAALVIFWSGIGFYHQAALDPKYHKIPVAYLLQWEAIKEAKRRGCKVYDFWGYVDPKAHPKHPWAGPSLFKEGFGGRAYEYVKTHDLPLSKKYWLTYIFEKLRKAKRGL